MDVPLPIGLQLLEALGIQPTTLQPIAFLAGAFVALLVPWARRRTKRGLCRFCGYPLVGLEEVPVCPECGRPRAVSHEWDRWAPVKYIALLTASLLPLLAALVLIAMQRSFDFEVLSILDTRIGFWVACTVGSFGFMFVHALVLIGAAARWRVEMGWVVPLFILAVFADETAIVLASMAHYLVT